MEVRRKPAERRKKEHIGARDERKSFRMLQNDKTDFRRNGCKIEWSLVE